MAVKVASSQGLCSERQRLLGHLLSGRMLVMMMTMATSMWRTGPSVLSVSVVVIIRTSRPSFQRSGFGWMHLMRCQVVTFDNIWWACQSKWARWDGRNGYGARLGIPGFCATPPNIKTTAINHPPDIELQSECESIAYISSICYLLQRIL